MLGCPRVVTECSGLESFSTAVGPLGEIGTWSPETLVMDGPEPDTEKVIGETP